VALILDLAVLAIAAVVVGSLALLIWTLAVSSVQSVRRGRAQVATARAVAADAEARIEAAGRRARDTYGDEFGPHADVDGEHTDR
jgi:hypothetical protein